MRLDLLNLDANPLTLERMRRNWQTMMGLFNDGLLPVRFEATPTITAAYTAQHGELVIVDASGGNFTVTLPSAAGHAGAVIHFKSIGASGTTTIDGAGSETIDGSATASLTTQYEAMRIVSDGTNWLKI